MNLAFIENCQKCKLFSELCTRLVIATLLGLSTFQLSFGQNPKSGGSDRIWSPPDKSFTLELPFNLEEIKGEYPESDPDGYTKIRLFGAMKSGYTFHVLILNLIEERKKLSLKEKLGGLQFVVGGDDDHEFTENYVRVAGLPSKKIVYAKQNSKGLMIDAGDAIYVLALNTENRTQLESDTAKRFFSSFRLPKSSKR